MEIRRKLAPGVRSNPPDPLFKGAIRAYGLSIAARLPLPASFGPASDDALGSHAIHTLRPPRICCRKYTDPAGRLMTTC